MPRARAAAHPRARRGRAFARGGGARIRTAVSGSPGGGRLRRQPEPPAGTRTAREAGVAAGARWSPVDLGEVPRVRRTGHQPGRRFRQRQRIAPPLGDHHHPVIGRARTPRWRCVPGGARSAAARRRTPTRAAPRSRAARPVPPTCARSRRPDITRSPAVSGIAESAGRSSRLGAHARGDEMRAERGDHRAVVGAQRRPRARAPDAVPRRARSSASARSREFAATPPPMTSVSMPYVRHASIAFAVSTSQTASWNCAATSATGTGSPARSRASTQRATAVLRPENEKSKRCAARSFGRGEAARERDRRRIAVAGRPVDRRAAGERHAQAAGPPCRTPPRRRRRWSRPSGVDPAGEVVDPQQRRVAAGDQQRDRRLGQRAVLQGVDRDVRGEVVHAVDRLARRRARTPWPRRPRPAARRPAPGRR